jgi:hypothetical protein
MVQPTANAGPALRVIIALGKFHGVMAPHTPTGWRITTMRASGLWLGMVSPLIRLASSAKNSMNEEP